MKSIIFDRTTVSVGWKGSIQFPNCPRVACVQACKRHGQKRIGHLSAGDGMMGSGKSVASTVANFRVMISELAPLCVRDNRFNISVLNSSWHIF